METKKLGRTNVSVPVLGMGTWLFVSSIPDRREDRVAIEALRTGIDLGMTLIDTAEQYGYGHAEEIVGEAVAGIRERVFIATKVSPEHFTRKGMLSAARNSLKRLRTSYIDLYQLHRPNPYVPIRETMGAMEELVDSGAVRHIGVSNFSTEQVRKAQDALKKYEIVSNQVSYSLLDREIEGDVLPEAQKVSMTIIAYSPLAHGQIFRYSGGAMDELERLAAKYGKTIGQIALNWLIAKDQVIAIPKAIQIPHLREDAGAAGWRMEPVDYGALEEAFSTVTWGWA